MVDAPETEGVSLTQEHLDSAQATYGRLASTENSSPAVQKLVAYAAYLPGLAQQIRQATQDGEPGELQKWAVMNSPANAAFDHAGMALNSCSDAILAIYGLLVKAQVLPGSVVYTLARQACESALLVRWLLEVPTQQVLIERGFATEWEDACRQQEFVKNMVEAGAVEPREEPQLRIRASEKRRKVEERGRALGLLVVGKKGPRPRVTVPSVTALFESVSGPEPHTDMRWIFNLLSGVAHGKAWATLATCKHEILREYVTHSANDQVVRSGIVLAKSDPNAQTMLLPIQIAMLQIGDALVRYQRARDVAVSPN